MSKQSNLLLRPLRTGQAQNRVAMLGDWRLKSWDLVSTGPRGTGQWGWGGFGGGPLKITNIFSCAVLHSHAFIPSTAPPVAPSQQQWRQWTRTRVFKESEDTRKLQSSYCQFKSSRKEIQTKWSWWITNNNNDTLLFVDAFLDDNS